MMSTITANEPLLMPGEVSVQMEMEAQGWDYGEAGSSGEGFTNHGDMYASHQQHGDVDGSGTHWEWWQGREYEGGGGGVGGMGMVIM